MEFDNKYRKQGIRGHVFMACAITLYAIVLPSLLLGWLFVEESEEEAGAVFVLLALTCIAGAVVFTIFSCKQKRSYTTIKNQYLSAMYVWIQTGQLAPLDASRLLSNEDKICEKNGNTLKTAGKVLTIISGAGVGVHPWLCIFIVYLLDETSFFSATFELLVLLFLAELIMAVFSATLLPGSIYLLVNGNRKKKELFRLGV